MSLKPHYLNTSEKIRRAARRRFQRPYLRLATRSANEDSIIVLKFGSSVLRSDPTLAIAVSEIYRHIRRGRKVFAVVSALHGATERLIESARSKFEDPDPACLARLLATGESASASLLGMALEQSGIQALVLDPAQAGFLVSGPSLDADPEDLDTRKIRRLLKTQPVVVFPGFFGRTASGAIALLGRGGSDFTAVFAAHRLMADQCCLLKDTHGIFSEDPGAAGKETAAFVQIGWNELLDLTQRAVQPKAVRFAGENGLEFTVRAPLSEGGTVVGRESAKTGDAKRPLKPLRVALLGLGNVGLGVYRRLIEHPDRFQVTGIAVKDLRKERCSSVPARLLTDDPWSLLRTPTDIVVELIGGRDPAAGLIQAALEAGSHVVTANKAVLARDWDKLKETAASHGVRLSCSASVCGAVPILESVLRLARYHRIEGISGVINGTCNFVLDRMAGGVDFPDAVKKAQESGFAEADPRTDLSGADSADKLAILAHAAFGAGLPLDDVDCQGIERLDSRFVRVVRASGKVVRLVASCRRTARGVKSQVKPVVLRSSHPLAATAGAENRVLLDIPGRAPILLSGKGAGRWPTSLAVFADLLDLHFTSSSVRGTEEEKSGPDYDNNEVD